MALVLLLAASTRVATAQVAPATPAPLEAGDIVWTFAQEPPLFDDRIAAALATIMVPALQASPDRTRFVRVSSRGPDFEPAFIAPSGDVPKLFAAAGFEDPSVLNEVGQCKAWAAPDAVQVRARLVAALDQALDSLAINARPCVATDNAAEAHVLVWRHGGAAPALSQRNEPTFLAAPSAAPPAPRRPAGAGATDSSGPVPRAPSSGSAGIEDGAATQPQPVLAAAAALALVVAARRLTRRPRGT